MFFKIEELTVHYGKVEAIKGVSMEVEQGQIVTLIGANGAGKSTILRTVCGLKRPSSGRIFFKGARIDGMPPNEVVKAGIVQVPEGRRLFPYMTTLENLKTGAYLRKDSAGVNRDLQEMYSHFPIIKERLNELALSLSGGEQQMVAVARALMAKPTLLLMDEPSLGLSPIMVQEVGRIVRDINEKGATIILVEQNASMALRLAHRAYVVETGRVVLTGTGDELLRSEHVKKAYLGG